MRRTECFVIEKIRIARKSRIVRLRNELPRGWHPLCAVIIFFFVIQSRSNLKTVVETQLWRVFCRIARSKADRLNLVNIGQARQRLSSSSYFVVVEKKLFKLWNFVLRIEKVLDLEPFFRKTANETILVDRMRKMLAVVRKTAFRLDCGNKDFDLFNSFDFKTEVVWN